MMSRARDLDKLVMVTVDLDTNTDNREYAAKAIGVPVRAIDPEHGVMILNPAIHRYVVMVDAEAFRDRRATDYAVGGPFSNPSIGTFEPSVQTHNVKSR